MRGLLYKDFTIVVQAYKKNAILTLALYFALAALLDMPFMMYALVFLCGMYVLSILSFDESSHWDVFARTLPVSPGQIVASKYLLGGGFMLGSFLVSFLLLALVQLARGHSAAAAMESLVGCIAALCVSLIYHAVSFPLSYMVGANKARSSVMMVMALFFLLGFLLFYLNPEGLHDFEAWLQGVNDRSVFLFFALMLAASVAVFAASGVVSAAIYKRKQY